MKIQLSQTEQALQVARYVTILLDGDMREYIVELALGAESDDETLATALAKTIEEMVEQAEVQSSCEVALDAVSGQAVLRMAVPKSVDFVLASSFTVSAAERFPDDLSALNVLAMYATLIRRNNPLSSKQALLEKLGVNTLGQSLVRFLREVKPDYANRSEDHEVNAAIAVAGGTIMLLRE